MSLTRTLIVISGTLAQSIPALQPSLIAQCREAVQESYPFVTESCGDQASDVFANSNPLIGILGSGKSMNNFCSQKCASAVSYFNIYIEQPCGGSMVFNGTELSSDKLESTFLASQRLACVEESGSYCMNTHIFPALTQFGYNPQNAQSLGQAFIKFATNETTACTACSMKLVGGLRSNASNFAQYGNMISVGASRINQTCAKTRSAGTQETVVWAVSVFFLVLL